MRRAWKTLLILAALAAPTLSYCLPVVLDYRIEGIKGELAENAKKRLKGKLELIKSDLDQEQLLAFYHQAENDIKLAIAPYGYFRASVTPHLKFVGKNRWFARFHVERGSPILLKHLDVKLLGPGRSDSAFLTVLRDFPLKRGQRFTIKSYNDAKDMLINLAAERGYFSAKMTENKLIIDHKPYGAEVSLTFQTGSRSRFGPVTFEYQDKPKHALSKRFLQRYVPFQQGDYYDNNLLNKLQANLSSSLYFQTVTVTPLSDQRQGTSVPITVRITARKSQQYNFGLGFGTDTGLRGLTDIHIKPLNSSGHYLNLNGKASVKALDNSAEFKIGYNIPGQNPNTDLYKISAEAFHNDDAEVGINNNLKMNTSYTNQLLNWEQTLALTLLFERSQPTGHLPTTTTFLIPNGRWIKLKSNDPTAPTQGYRFNISLRGASRATLGSTDFFQVYVQGKWLNTIGESFRIVARGELGLLVTDDPNKLPISLRHYAGGSQSVRGYHLNEIGKDFSGRTLSVGSIELQQRIYRDFYLAIFYDVGEVGSSIFKDYRQGVGAGIVWHSPVGALALTVANALDNPDHPTLIQFSMGPEL